MSDANTTISIDQFYKENSLDIYFDEKFYSSRFPETKDFYQPYCLANNISDKHRLYFHWVTNNKIIHITEIENFYAHNLLDPEFDENFYLKMYPEVKDFCQPYCLKNKINDKYRLYMHWALWGKKQKRFKNFDHMNKCLYLFNSKHTSLNHIHRKVCIIIHAYFFDVFKNDIIPALKKITKPYDLYITLSEENINSGIEQKEIKKIFPDANVLITPNRGADVGPFFKTLDLIIKSNKTYDYILKLHTKKSVHLLPEYVQILRHHYYRNLCYNIDYSIDIMEKDQSIGMIGPPYSRLLLTEEEDNTNINNFKNLLTQFNIKDHTIDFIAGTMFICRFNLLTKYFLSININMFEYGHKNDGTKAHAFERLFGNIVREQGQTIHMLGDQL